MDLFESLNRANDAYLIGWSFVQGPSSPAIPVTGSYFGSNPAELGRGGVPGAVVGGPKSTFLSMLYFST